MVIIRLKCKRHTSLVSSCSFTILYSYQSTSLAPVLYIYSIPYFVILFIHAVITRFTASTLQLALRVCGVMPHRRMYSLTIEKLIGFVSFISRGGSP